MKNGVKKVRKSIEHRKKARGLPYKGGSKKQIITNLPQEEEKHGYLPVFSDVSTYSNKEKAVSGFFLKGTLSVMLFFGAALLWKTDTEVLESPKKWTSMALTEEFPFAAVHHWYQETFGSPLAFTPPTEQANSGTVMALPVSGNVTETFQANGKGIMIEPEETTEVAALQEGIVIFAGNDQETNQTIIIQHPDGSNSTYGFLSSIDIHLYQYVGSNQRVGQFSPTEDSETVYFAIEKDNDYIDPVQVIQVDDQE